MNTKRPSFKKAKTAQAYNSPEELFGKLSNKARTHGYLRAPQGDALREYVKETTRNDIAFELPTGKRQDLVGFVNRGVAAAYLARKSGLSDAYKSACDASLRRSRETRI